MGHDRLSITNIESSTEPDHNRARGEEISIDDLARLLASARRRRLLSSLTAHPDDTVPIDDVIDRVAEREYPDPGPATQRARIATELHHVHLPKLADAGVVDYDPVAETVQYDRLDTLESLLATCNAVQHRAE